MPDLTPCSSAHNLFTQGNCQLMGFHKAALNEFEYVSSMDGSDFIEIQFDFIVMWADDGLL